MKGIPSQNHHRVYFGNSENALLRVLKDAVILELGEEDAEVLVVFLGGTAKDKDVVSVGKAEIQVFKDIVHEMLESWGGVM